MGLSSLPSPSESILTLILANTALYVSILKGIFGSFLELLRLSSPQPQQQPPETLAALPEPTVTDRFRSRFRPVRFESAFSGRRRPGSATDCIADCRVCLSRFEPESVVNRLPCGHLFHKACLETWLDYRHATCPLCRTHVLCGDGGSSRAAIF